MTMETNTRWLSLLSIAWLTGLTDVADDTGAFEVHCGPSVTAEVGDTVTLLCHTEPQRNVSDKRVEWLRGDDEVHLRRKGHDDFTNQSPAYKNRTSLSVYELSKGNCSLKLSDVLESDNGPYRCSVRINKEKECYTNLTVLPHGKNTSPGDQHLAISPTEKPGGDTGTSQMSSGAITGITAAVVVAAISFFGFIGRKIFCNPCAGQDRGRPGEEHELAPMAGNIPPDPRAGQDREDLGRGEEE